MRLRERLPAAAVALAALALLPPAPGLRAQSSNLEIHGFVLGNYAGRTTGVAPAGAVARDYLLAEERLRLDLETWSEGVDASARVKVDFLHDAITDVFDVDLREAAFDYAAGAFDFRLGRQITTWGVGDLLFINDVFPKDWVSFFSGRPLEYLKVGADGLRTRYTADPFSVDVVLLPRFTPDRLPSPDRFFFFDPFAAVPSRTEALPGSDFENTELAVRLYRRLLGFDVSLHAYRGFWRSPGAIPDDTAAPTSVTIFYPELSVYGASAQGGGFGGMLSLEVGWYDSREDRRGADPGVPNSQFRFLSGYQRAFGDDLSIGVQYYAEVMADHDAYEASLPAGFPRQRRYRDTVTLRVERLLKYHTWKITWFSFYSPADRDYLLQPQVFHRIADEFSLTVGANLFGGETETTFRGPLDRNDTAWLSAGFDFCAGGDEADEGEDAGRAPFRGAHTPRFPTPPGSTRSPPPPRRPPAGSRARGSIPRPPRASCPRG
jgi:hypothetical protein